VTSNITPEALLDTMSRALCEEQCALSGEPACHRMGDWPNKDCDKPGCIALARAAVAVMAVK
jgi:hypothetical protein